MFVWLYILSRHKRMSRSEFCIRAFIMLVLYSCTSMFILLMLTVKCIKRFTVDYRVCTIRKSILNCSMSTIVRCILNSSKEQIDFIDVRIIIESLFRSIPRDTIPSEYYIYLYTIIKYLYRRKRRWIDSIGNNTIQFFMYPLIWFVSVTKQPTRKINKKSRTQKLLSYRRGI